MDKRILANNKNYIPILFNVIFQRIKMDNNFNFLIIGAGRGGTSLIMALLDYHSKLELISEFNSVKYLMGHGIKNETGLNIVDNRISMFNNSCIEEASKHPNKLWGNKITTEQLRGLNNLNENPIDDDQLFDMFFKGYLETKKKIFILRDGRNCVISKVNRTDKNMEQACEAWNYSVTVYKYLKTNSNSLCIKFEDLIISPVLTLIQISKFLEITFEEKMLEGVLNKKLSPDYQNAELIKEKTIPLTIEKKYFNLIEANLKYCNY